MNTDPVSNESPLSPTILLVDDHEIFRRTLMDWLGIAFPDTHVLEVSTGEEALALLETDSPQIILMDITLPGINGLETTRRIKTTHPSTHIVVLTVHDDSSYREHATAAGASAFVSKQAIPSNLVSTLSTFLANYHVGGSTDSIH